MPPAPGNRASGEHATNPAAIGGGSVAIRLWCSVLGICWVAEIHAFDCARAIPPAPPRSMRDADTSTPLPPTTANAPRTPMSAALSIARAISVRACSSGMSMVRDTLRARKYTELQTVYLTSMSAEHWGRRPRDWAELAEPSNEPLFAEVLRRLGVGAGTRLLDVGCGSGYAAAMAAGLGALRDRDSTSPRS